MHPSDAYLRLAEGPDDLLGNELSFTRRLLTFVVALVLFSGTTLFATAALDLDHGLIGKALATTGSASHDGDDDNEGPGGGGDDDDNEADDNDDNQGDVNNLATGGGASHSDDNHDGDSDSSTDQPNAQFTDSGTDDNHNGATDSHEAGEQRARR
jgi:hypothetical protein